LSSSTRREHSDGSNESPNIIAPSKTSIIDKIKGILPMTAIFPHKNIWEFYSMQYEGTMSYHIFLISEDRKTFPTNREIK